MANRCATMHSLEYLTQCSVCKETYSEAKCFKCSHNLCLNCLDKYGEDYNFEEWSTCPPCRKKVIISQLGVRDTSTNCDAFSTPKGRKCKPSKSSDTFPKRRDQGNNRKEVNEVLSSSFNGAIYNDLDKPSKTKQDQWDKIYSWTAKPRNGSKTAVEAQKIVLLAEKSISVKSSSLIDSLTQKLSSQTLSFSLDSSSCKNHNNAMVEFYCYDCNEVICVECRTRGHTNHECRFAHNALQYFVENLRKNDPLLKKCIEETSNELNVVIAHKEETVKHMKEAEQEIEKLFKNLHDVIYAEQNKLVEQLHEFRDKELKIIKTRKEDLKRHHHNLTTVANYANKLISAGKAYEIVAQSQDVLSDTDEIIDKLHHWIRECRLKIGTAVFEVSNVSDVESGRTAFTSRMTLRTVNCCDQAEDVKTERTFSFEAVDRKIESVKPAVEDVGTSPILFNPVDDQTEHVKAEETFEFEAVDSNTECAKPAGQDVGIIFNSFTAAVNEDESPDSMKATWLKTINNGSVRGMAQLWSRIYILTSNWAIIYVYDTATNAHLKPIEVQTTQANDIVTCHVDCCIYVSDSTNACVWKIRCKGRSGSEQPPEKWLSTEKDYTWMMSVTSDGLLVMLHRNADRSLTEQSNLFDTYDTLIRRQSFDEGGYTSLDLYGSDACLISSIDLSPNIRGSLHHAVQTTSGDFIISHDVTDERHLGILWIAPGGDIKKSWIIPSNSKNVEQLAFSHLAIDNVGSAYITNGEEVWCLESTVGIWKTLQLGDKENEVRITPRRICHVKFDSDRRLLISKNNEIHIYSID